MRHAHESRVLRENTGRSISAGVVWSGVGTLLVARGGVAHVVPLEIKTYYKRSLFWSI